jgi:hypothetical protein
VQETESVVNKDWLLEKIDELLGDSKDGSVKLKSMTKTARKPL